jgi:hypothetical protein
MLTKSTLITAVAVATISIASLGIAAWASSSHVVKAAVEPAQIDPFSLMANAKNLPTQEELNSKMWPDNGVVRY